MDKKLDIFAIVYLKNIFIYIKDPSLSYVNAIWLVLKKLRKNCFFANLKKYQFYKDKVCFLSYIVLAQKVQIEDKKINVVKNWLEPKSI